MHCISQSWGFWLIPAVGFLERLDGCTDQCVISAANIEIRAEGNDMIVHRGVDGSVDAISILIGVGVASKAGGARLGMEGAEDETTGADFDFNRAIQVE